MKSVTFGRAIVDVGYALVYDGGVIVQVVVKFALIHQLRVLGVHRLELDGNFEVGFDVQALEDLAEGSLIDFANYLVVFPNFLWHLRHVLIMYLNNNFQIRATIKLLQLILQPQHFPHQTHNPVCNVLVSAFMAFIEPKCKN